MKPELTPASITFDDAGNPYATEFGDCYFSKQGALAEARYVYLEGNHLPQRWAKRDHFTITELGFGTGLNFLATWYEWQNDPQRCTQLHYIALEKHPIPRSILQQLLHWEELQPYRDSLLAAYPPLVQGMHTLYFAQGRVQLTLCFDDAAHALQELTAKADAWYLDGFAPDRNEVMWSETTLQRMAHLSAPNATLATFSAASVVRKRLEWAGFKVQKRKGFGTKREMITATLPNPPLTPHLQPWFTRAQPQYSEKTATIIGAGVAGCQTAYALAQRGWQVTVLERHAQIASEASGNPAGVVSPKMTAHWSLGEQFYRQAFSYATQQLNTLKAQDDTLDWFPVGALQLNHDTRETERWQALHARGLDHAFIQLLDAQQAGEVAGIQLPFGGSFFPRGGYLNPASWCKVLLAHPNITLQLHTEALELQQTTSGWHSFTHQHTLNHSTVVVITNGRDAGRFLNQAHFPLQAVWGQTTRAPVTHNSAKLQTVLGHEGYCTPAYKQEHTFGATFERQTENFALNAQANEMNWQQLQSYLPELANELREIKTGHGAVRMSAPDRFPYVGAVADGDFYQRAYVDLHHGRHWQHYPEAQYQRGLYVLTGLGSRGLTTSALCANLLAAEINQEPLPLQHSLQQALHSARFIIRALKRNA